MVPKMSRGQEATCRSEIFDRGGWRMEGPIEDQIYEAAAVAELWPQVIERIADRVGADGGFLFTVTATGPRWVTSERIAEAIEAYFAGGYQLRDERTRRLLARSYPGFSVD